MPTAPLRPNLTEAGLATLPAAVRAIVEAAPLSVCGGLARAFGRLEAADNWAAYWNAFSTLNAFGIAAHSYDGVTHANYARLMDYVNARAAVRSEALTLSAGPDPLGDDE